YRQEPARPAPDPDLCRSEPRRCRIDGDRLRTDLRSAEEAGVYLRKLRSILRYLGTCDGNMEEGSLRCDCNVSVRRPGEPYGTRCEIKNLNSIRYAMQAIDYEGRRQVDILEQGGRVEQQTRLFDARRGITQPTRSNQ